MTTCAPQVATPRGLIKELANGIYGLSYQTDILGSCLQIKIVSRLGAADVIEVRRRLDLTIGLINANERRLSELQKGAIRAIKEVHADPSRHTGVSVSRQLYDMRTDYVKSASTAWLAATFVHDGTHILQKQRGAIYDEKNAASLEKEANMAMLGVGSIFGLTAEEMNTIRRDRHTAYNVNFY